MFSRYQKDTKPVSTPSYPSFRSFHSRFHPCLHGPLAGILCWKSESNQGTQIENMPHLLPTPANTANQAINP